ncbi:GNAT family N-acetyltransferase [Aquimarina agarivorans]|uniref:GNAT family N-acetyltransferase n=1 Tax=Aquimarina agarivorans TaxID=980584 RepID=UPI000248F2EE|nr:GNAT family N-acetyltransferase [Aquimarina agarivorans]
MSLIFFKEIAFQQTWKIRHKVMWPNMPLDYIKLPHDPKGLHYGLFLQDSLIAVASLFIDKKENTAQFRKFATLQSEQGKGYGSKLLVHVMQQASNMNINKIWCNARTEKCSFYEKFGWQQTPHKFVKNNLQYVVMEKHFSEQKSNKNNR